MKKLPSVLLLFGLVFIVAACAAGVSIALYSKFQKSTHQNAHDWIHSQLGLTAEQDRSLEPIEKNYRAQRRELEQQLLLGNRELAEAILADGKDSQRVHEAVEKIHVYMGTLQKLTIGHVFEMEAVLTPGQYQKLLNLTANALYNLDSDHGAE